MDPFVRISCGNDPAVRKSFRRRVKVFIALSLLLVAMQTFFMYVKVFEISPQVYSENAWNLKENRKWRYGYVRGWHGAVLVKTRNEGQSIPVNTGIYDHEITQAMARELEMVPWKFAGELMLYLSLLGFMLFIPRWWGHCLGESGRLRWIMPMYAVLWASAWVVFLLPLLAMGYGGSIFTNLEGPGALSFSGPYLLTAIPADTVSYRFVLEASGILPFVVGKVAMSLLPVTMAKGMSTGMALLLFGIFIYGTYGLLFGANFCQDERNRTS